MALTASEQKPVFNTSRIYTHSLLTLPCHVAQYKSHSVSMLVFSKSFGIGKHVWISLTD